MIVADDQIVGRIVEILDRADLTTITFAAIRRQLEEDFRTDLTDKKAFIREQVDLYLRFQQHSHHQQQHHHHQQQQNLEESRHFNHICWDSNGVREVCEKSRAALDSLKQLFLICWKEEETASPPHHHHHHHHQHHQNLPTPYRLINFSWDSNESEIACEKSKNALNNLNMLSLTLEPQLEQLRSHLFNLLSNKNLFLIHIETGKTTKYVSYARGDHDWGGNDIMVNLRGDTTLEQRMAYLKCAAHFRGGSVHLLHLKVLT